MDIVHSEAIFNLVYYGRICHPDILPFCVLKEVIYGVHGECTQECSEIVDTHTPNL